MAFDGRYNGRHMKIIKDPAYKPLPHFCPMLACTREGGGGVILGFYGMAIILYVGHALECNNCLPAQGSVCTCCHWHHIMATIMIRMHVMCE